MGFYRRIHRTRREDILSVSTAVCGWDHIDETPLVKRYTEGDVKIRHAGSLWHSGREGGYSHRTRKVEGFDLTGSLRRPEPQVVAGDRNREGDGHSKARWQCFETLFTTATGRGCGYGTGTKFDQPHGICDRQRAMARGRR